MELLVEFLQFDALLSDLAHRMQHRGVIAPSEQLADLRQALVRQLLGEVHGDLARTGDAGRALFGIHIGHLDLVEVGHGFLDVFDRHLAILQRQQIFERFLGQTDRHVLAAEAGVGQNFAQRAFEFTHIRSHVLGDKKRHFFRQMGQFGIGLAQQNGHAHFEFGRLDGHGQTGIEAGDQALIHLPEFLGVGVAGENDLRAFGDQRLESVEKLFLRLVFAGEKLHVVDQQQVERVVVALEFLEGLALVGTHHFADELLGLQVTNAGARLLRQQRVADRVHEVGLAQTDAAVDEQRVVGAPGVFRHLNGRGAGKLVGLAGDQGFEAEHGVEARALQGVGFCGISRSVTHAVRTGQLLGRGVVGGMSRLR